MPDRPGPRRIVPIPGVIDLDAVEDANLAEAFGDDPPPEPDDPLSPPAPPPLDDRDGSDAPHGDREAPDPEGSDVAPEPAPLADAIDEGATEEGTAPTVTPPLSSDEDEPAEPQRQEEEGPEDTLSGFPDGPTSPPPAEPPGDDPPTADAPPNAPPSESTASPLSTPADADRQPDALSPSTAVVETAKTVTRDRGREFVQLVVKYGKDHVPVSPPKTAEPDTGPPRMVGRVGQLIPFLRVIPWALAALFALSFWWDLDGQAVTLFGRTLELDGLLKVLTVSGLIGFGTNWLAITMLFQPREKRAIIPQGLIPAQRERVIYRLSQAISKELINADIIKQKIQESGVIGRYRDLAVGVVRGVVEDPGFRTDLKTLAQGYAQEVLGSEPVRREVARLAVSKVEEQAGGGLGGVALRLYRTFAEDDFQRRVDRALDELPDAVVPLLDRIDTALDAVPAKVEAHADEIEEVATSAVLSFVEGFDVQSMIREKARGFDEGQLENLLKSTSNEQLNYIKYLGAILGVFGGFIIWEPIGAITVFVTISLALWAVDEALVRARR